MGRHDEDIGRAGDGRVHFGPHPPAGEGRIERLGRLSQDLYLAALAEQWQRERNNFHFVPVL